MRVSEAVRSRFSCRAFRPDPVPEATVRAILEGARQAPSGGNLQPWHTYVLTGAPLKALVAEVTWRLGGEPRGEGAEYAVYPDPLKEPYAARRFRCGEDLYESIDVARQDKAGRWRQFHRNFRFFDAPVGLFFFIDRSMGLGQWADLGMYLQTVMLLAREHGLHSCAQEAWAGWHRTVSKFLEAPPELMLFSGLALGHMDEEAPINRFRTERAGLAETVVFRGF
jgi:nitroreductase